MPPTRNLKGGWGWDISPLPAPKLRLWADSNIIFSVDGTGVIVLTAGNSLRIPTTGQLQLGAPNITWEAVGVAGAAGSGYSVNDDTGNKLFSYIKGAAAQSGHFGGEHIIWQDRDAAYPNPHLDFYQWGNYGENALRWAHLDGAGALITASIWVLGNLPDVTTVPAHYHFQFNKDGNNSAWLVDGPSRAWVE